MTDRAAFLRARPYQADELNLPVGSVAAALPFYLESMGFALLERHDAPVPRAVLGRDAVRIGLAENGGDPTQDGCFFEVDDVLAAFAELRKAAPGKQDITVHQFGPVSFRAFFVVAPDGLCYMVGQRLDPNAPVPQAR